MKIKQAIAEMVRKDWNEHLNDCESLVPMKSFDKLAAALELAVKQRDDFIRQLCLGHPEALKNTKADQNEALLAILEGSEG